MKKILTPIIALLAFAGMAQTTTQGLSLSVPAPSPQTLNSNATAVIPAVNNPTINGALQDLAVAVLNVTNYAFAVGGGHQISGGSANIAFVDLLYNFNQNAGLLIGYRQIIGGKNDGGSVVRGGLSLQAPMAPFKNLGLTNLVCTPFVFDCIATSINGGGIGNILGTGVDFNLVKLGASQNWVLHGGAFYEKVSGGTPDDGGYLCGHLALSHKF